MLKKEEAVVSASRWVWKSATWDLGHVPVLEEFMLFTAGQCPTQTIIFFSTSFPISAFFYVSLFL